MPASVGTVIYGAGARNRRRELDRLMADAYKRRFDVTQREQEGASIGGCARCLCDDPAVAPSCPGPYFD